MTTPSTGRLTRRTVFSTRSEGCPCLSTRTIYRSRRTLGREHSFHVDAVGIYQVCCSVTLRHYCSPCPPLAIRLLDSSLMRRFANWSRAAEVAGPHVDPMSGPCCRARLSIAWCRRLKYQYSWRHRYDLGTVAPRFDCAGPIQRCYHHCSSWSRPSSRGW